MGTLTTKKEREKLAPRREPYWLQIRKGSYLGYRAGPNTWIVRHRDRTGKQNYRSLGEQPDYPAAKAEAERWLELITAGSRRTPSRGTVRSALAAYLQHLRSHGRRDTAREASARFRLTVGRKSDFGAMRLEDVTRDDVEAWRRGLRPHRQARSINRQVRAVVAALNCAVEERGHLGDKQAWALSQLTDDTEQSGESAVFITPEQRDRLIAAAPKPLAALLRGLGHTGARPSELAAATVADFEPAGGTVTLRHRKGRPARLKARAVTLGRDGVEFFRAAAQGKLPAARLLATEMGARWRRFEWSRGIRAAAKAANAEAEKAAQRIPEGASAYSFRHARISELLQVYKVDPLTVAQQTGTSVAMMEKAYFKFIPSAMHEKLNAVRAS